MNITDRPCSGLPASAGSRVNWIESARATSESSPPAVAVAINSCRRPKHDVQVAYPGVPGHYLLVLQSKGAFRLRSRLHDLIVDAATCVIGRAGESAEVSHPFGTGDRATYVALSPSLFADVSANHPSVPASAPVTGLIARLHYQLVVSILREHDVLLVQETGLRVFEAALAAGGSPSPARTASLSAQRRIVDEACGLLAADPSLNSLVEISRSVGCSPHHLSRSFRRLLGKTISQHRSELRVHSALALLGDGEQSLATIAAQCGFSDHAHLTRSFRRFAGTTPSSLRDHARSGSSTDVQARADETAHADLTSRSTPD